MKEAKIDSKEFTLQWTKAEKEYPLVTRAFLDQQNELVDISKQLLILKYFQSFFEEEEDERDRQAGRIRPPLFDEDKFRQYLNKLEIHLRNCRRDFERAEAHESPTAMNNYFNCITSFP